MSNLVSKDVSRTSLALHQCPVHWCRARSSALSSASLRTVSSGVPSCLRSDDAAYAMEAAATFRVGTGTSAKKN